MASGVMTTGLDPKLLLPGIRELFGLNLKDLEKVYERVFEMKSSDKNFEEVHEIAGVGLASQLGEGEAITYDSMVGGPTARFVHAKYNKAMIITEEAIEDNLYLRMMSEMTRELAKSLVHAKDITAANILNRAFNSSYTTADGIELCATNHNIAVGGTFRNELATAADFSESAVEQAVIDIYDIVGSDGLKKDLKPVSILIPHNLTFDVHRTLKSNLRVNTSNNDANALRDMGLLQDVIVWRRLTDTDAWFILTDVKPGLLCFNRRAPRIVEDKSFDIGALKVKSDERYSVGVADVRAVFGSPGA